MMLIQYLNANLLKLICQKCNFQILKFDHICFFCHPLKSPILYRLVNLCIFYTTHVTFVCIHTRFKMLIFFHILIILTYQVKLKLNQRQ
jgi:hypothetical protein